VLGGVDRLVHGANNLRGWGGTAFVDQAFFKLRAYDAASGTPEQTTELRAAEDSFSVKVRAIYRDLARYLVAQNGGANAAALERSRAAKTAYWSVFWEQPEVVQRVMTPMQLELLPLLRNFAALPKASRKDSQWFFGHNVTLTPRPPKSP
jgi:hypothetical protein